MFVCSYLVGWWQMCRGVTPVLTAYLMSSLLFPGPSTLGASVHQAAPLGLSLHKIFGWDKVASMPLHVPSLVHAFLLAASTWNYSILALSFLVLCLGLLLLGMNVTANR